MLSETNGIVSCEERCDSGIFEQENPEHCLDACPSDMLLIRDGARQLCGHCAGYTYFDRASVTTTCVSYAQCIAAGMVPQIVRENGKSVRLCGEAAVQTAFAVGEEAVDSVRGIALRDSAGTMTYYALSGRTVRSSSQSYTDARDNGVVVEDGVTALGQYLDGIFALREDNTLAIIGSSKAEKANIENVAWADGSEDFGAYVTTDGIFYCESPAGLCPAKVFPNTVHGVSSANKFGITL